MGPRIGTGRSCRSGGAGIGWSGGAGIGRVEAGRGRVEAGQGRVGSVPGQAWSGRAEIIIIVVYYFLILLLKLFNYLSNYFFTNIMYIAVTYYS